jgi:hypothetical protein
LHQQTLAEEEEEVEEEEVEEEEEFNEPFRRGRRETSTQRVQASRNSRPCPPLQGCDRKGIRCWMLSTV